MRKEPYGVDSFVHVVKRGTRGIPIVHDEDDKKRFLLMLAHFNDTYQPENWFRDITHQRLHPFERPLDWPKQKKIVKIISFCLLTNHFHLLLQETEEGGISKFMQRIGTAMTNHFNEKYDERGSLFQGAYRARTITHDSYLRYVLAYIHVKNIFDVLHLHKQPFEKGYQQAQAYQFASLGDHVGDFDRPIVECDFLQSLVDPKEFQRFSADFIAGRRHVPAEEEDVICFE